MIGVRGWIVCGTVMLAFILLPFAGTRFYIDLVTELLIWALLALSLDLMFGFINLYSFGHAALFGAGGYATAMAVQYGNYGFWPALGLGLSASIAVGVVMALFVARSAGVTFIIVSVLLSSVLFMFAHVATSVTGGDNGIYLFRSLFILPNVLAAGTPLYYVALAALGLALMLSFRLVNSRFGHVVLSIRENESRTQAMGYNTVLFKVTLTMISASLAGLAGCLNIVMNKFVSPEAVSVTLSAQVVVWTLFGGRGTLIGPVVGAAVFVLLGDMLSRVMVAHNIVLGVLLILTVIFLPGGLIEAARPLWSRGILFSRFRR